MDVAETLARLHDSDVVLQIDGDRVRFRPSTLDPELIAAIRQNKQALIETILVIFDGKPPSEIRCKNSG